MYQSILRDKVTFDDSLGISDEFKDFVTQLLKKEVGERLGSQRGARDVIEHPWFRDIDMYALEQKALPAPYRPEAFAFPGSTAEQDTGESYVSRRRENMVNQNAD